MLKTLSTVRLGVLVLAALWVANGPVSVVMGQSSSRPSVYARGGSVAIDEAPRPAPPPMEASSMEASKVTPTIGNFPAFTASSSGADGSEVEPPSAFAIPAVTVTSSLAIVLGLFAILVWGARKYGASSIAPGSIPREVMQTLGSTAIDGRTRLTMIRCGNKILVLAQSANGVTPISEITDPEEVRHLAATCVGDSRRSFASTLESIEKEPVASGFVDHDATVPRPAARTRGSLFTTA